MLVGRITKRKSKTPKQIVNSVSSAGDWVVTPDNNRLTVDGTKGKKRVLVVESNSEFSPSVNMDESENVELRTPENDDFEAHEDSQVVTLTLEVKEMERKLAAKKLVALQKRKDELQRQLDESDHDHDDMHVVQEAKRKSKTQGIKDKNNEWEGLLNDSVSSLDQVSKSAMRKSGMPPFEVVASMFSDNNSGGKRRKSAHKVEVKESSESDEDDSDMDSGEEDSSQGDSDKGKNKGSVKSGIFAKASETKIVKSVLHAQAMLDQDETLKKVDFNFHELPFALLVAGEMEIVLSNISPEEKWTRLNLLKKLAYNAQFLEHSGVVGYIFLIFK